MTRPVALVQPPCGGAAPPSPRLDPSERSKPMTSKRRIPPGLFGAQHDGLADPQRPSLSDRLRKSPARIEAERRDRA